MRKIVAVRDGSVQVSFDIVEGRGRHPAAWHFQIISFNVGEGGGGAGYMEMGWIFHSIRG
jgi:hypothetical protein